MNKINSEEFYNLLQEYKKSEKIDVILFYREIKRYIHNAMDEEKKKWLKSELKFLKETDADILADKQSNKPNKTQN